MPQRRWMRVKLLSEAEKDALGARCECFIAEVLKPRFLPEIRPTQFNYCVDIKGKWRGSQYSFIQRYRSGRAPNLGEEWDSPFTRLDHADHVLSEQRFDIMWMRHTGKWWPLHSEVTLEDALRLIEEDEMLWPT